LAHRHARAHAAAGARRLAAVGKGADQHLGEGARLHIVNLPARETRADLAPELAGIAGVAERAELEDEKSRLYDLWQTNLGKAKGEAARLFGERAKRKGKWAEWVRAELDGMSPPEFSNMVRSEVNKLMAAAK